PRRRDRLLVPRRGRHGAGARARRHPFTPGLSRRRGGGRLLLDPAHGARSPRAVRRPARRRAMTAQIVFDHLALATEHWADAWPRLAGDLGGRWASGGQAQGYSP